MHDKCMNKALDDENMDLARQWTEHDENMDLDNKRISKILQSLKRLVRLKRTEYDKMDPRHGSRQ